MPLQHVVSLRCRGFFTSLSLERSAAVWTLSSGVRLARPRRLNVTHHRRQRPERRARRRLQRPQIGPSTPSSPSPCRGPCFRSSPSRTTVSRTSSSSAAVRGTARPWSKASRLQVLARTLNTTHACHGARKHSASKQGPDLVFLTLSTSVSLNLPDAYATPEPRMPDSFAALSALGGVFMTRTQPPEQRSGGLPCARPWRGPGASTTPSLPSAPRSSST